MWELSCSVSSADLTESSCSSKLSLSTTSSSTRRLHHAAITSSLTSSAASFTSSDSINCRPTTPRDLSSLPGNCCLATGTCCPLSWRSSRDSVRSPHDALQHTGNNDVMHGTQVLNWSSKWTTVDCSVAKVANRLDHDQRDKHVEELLELRQSRELVK